MERKQNTSGGGRGGGKWCIYDRRETKLELGGEQRRTEDRGEEGK